jgi:hypothetical protein
MSLIPIDEVVHFDVVTHHPSTGAVTDADSGPTYDVFEENTDTPILDDQTLTKRTSLTGNYRGSFTASAANGFEAGKWYSVVATATVNSVTAKVVAAHFRVAPAESAAGVPKIDVSHLSGDSGAADNAESFFDGTGYAGTNNVIPTVTTLTNAPSDSAGVTTLLSRVPAALFSGITSLAQWLGLLAGKQTGNSTARTEVRATGAGSGTFDETTDSLEGVRDNMGTSQTGDAFARLGAPAGVSVSADVAAVKAQTAAIETDTQDIQGRLPSALISGRLDVTVGAMQANVLTASALAADAVDEILDEQIGDSTITVRQALRVFMASLAGKASGAATTTMTFRNVADDTNRIVATVDADGNRSAITLNV